MPGACRRWNGPGYCRCAWGGLPFGSVDASAPPTQRVDTVDGSASSPSRRRALGALVAIGAAALLVVAAVMTPAAAGIGTHTRLGLPPCTWVTLMDLPCPTCGMTTAFAHAADGDLVASFLTQPLGAVLALATAIAFLVGGYVAITGSRVGTLFPQLWGRRLMLGVVLFALAAWGYKILAYKEEWYT